MAEPLRRQPFFTRLDLPADFLTAQDLALAQDEDGFFWVGSATGLFRWDGYQMLPFPRLHAGERDVGTPPRNDCEAVLGLQAVGRHLWLGTSCGVERLDLDTETWDRWQITVPSGARVSVRSLQHDARGRLWLGTSHGLFWLDPAGKELSERWRDRLARQDLPDALRHEPIRAFYLDDDGGMWIGSTAGAYFFDPWLDSVREIPFGAPTSNPSHQWVEAIHRDSAGTLWFTTADGLRRLESDPTRASAGTLILEDQLALLCRTPAQQWHYGMATDTGGRLWIAVGGNLISWLPGSSDVECYYRFNKDLFGLGGSAGHLLTAHDGTLWVATERTIERRTPTLFSAWDYSLEKILADRGWKPSWSTSPMLDSSGNLWVGSNLGLFEIDLDSHQILRHFIADYPQLLIDANRPTMGDLPNINVFATARQVDGTVWAGTSHGLARLVPGEERFEHVTLPTGLSEEPRILYLLATTEHLWVGTSQALHSFSFTQDTWSRLSLPEELGPPDTSFQVHDLALDPARRLWVGTQEQGLLVVEPGTGELSIPQIDFEDPKPLREDNARSLYLETPRRLWVAYETSGVFRIDLETRTATRPKWAGNLGNRYLRDMVRVGDTYWLLTPLGLSRAEAEEQHVVHFDSRDGLIDQDSLYGLIALEDGRLFVTGSALFEFTPSSHSLEVPPVRWTALRLFNERMSPRALDPSSPLERSLQSLHRVELDHHQAVATFEFSALGFARPKDLVYHYSLGGSAPQWLETRRGQNFVSFNQMAPGRYHLRVRATVEGAPAPEDPASEASLVLIVRPPWWRSPWAWLVYAATTLGLIALYGVSQRRKLGHERQVNTRLRRLDALKDDFLANTSHELRTPLFGITGLAEALLRGSHGAVPETMRRSLDLILSSGRRLSALIDDIRDFSRLRSGGLELELRPVELEPLAGDVLTLGAPLAATQRVTLLNAVPEDLPKAHADEARTRQILLNLVGNAIKFTTDGEVEIGARLRDGGLLISVRDDGVGIAPDHQESIFNSFEQIDGTATRTHGGTGLGLALTRQLVELHGGSLWVESEPGRGATFFFTLPVMESENLEATTRDATARDAKPPKEWASPENPTEIQTTPGETAVRASSSNSPKEEPEAETTKGSFEILIVDDEPVNLLILEAYLSASHYNLTTTLDGSQALELFARQRFDLILLDVMMPRMSGFEVCRAIRRQHSIETLPILFITARTEVADRVEGLAQGANDYLTKPVAKDELIARVEKELTVSKATRGAMEEVVELRQLLPVCSVCRDKRDVEALSQKLDEYFDEHRVSDLDHGLCAKCSAALPELQ